MMCWKYSSRERERQQRLLNNGEGPPTKIQDKATKVGEKEEEKERLLSLQQEERSKISEKELDISCGRHLGTVCAELDGRRQQNTFVRLIGKAAMLHDMFTNLVYSWIISFVFLLTTLHFCHFCLC